jgi:Topoisomerase 6 subunit A/Spo11, Toprim domain
MTDLLQRADWTDFRHIDGLVARGGVSATALRRLVAKELLDNALDAVDEVGGEICPTLTIEADGTIVVDDVGPGLGDDPAEIARLFAFGRDRLSSKYARRPSRGLLGNGLRLISGAVFASGGRLDVWTHDRQFHVTPRQDGITDVTWEPAERPIGTRVAVWLDPATITPDERISAWLTPALWMFGGERYTGRSSPHWFDGPTFFEYLQAASGETVRAAVARLARCTGTAAGELTRQWAGAASDLSPSDAAALLAHLQASVDPVSPKLLKPVGRRERGIGKVGLACYAVEEATFAPPSAHDPRATIPVVIETWGGPSPDGDVLQLCVNRSPSTAPLYLTVYPERNLAKVAGCGLDQHGVWIETKRRTPAAVLINITAPHLPRTSDGKAPDLGQLQLPIAQTIAKVLDAIERQSPSPKEPKPPKVQSIRAPRTAYKQYDDAVEERLDTSIAEVSSQGARRYTLRQLFYNVRSALLLAGECAGELKWGTFTKIIDQVESKRGHDLPGISRDPRGIILHPHTGEMTPLGTLAVEDYERPDWLFSNVLYIEKEGFFSILQENNWPERWDCAVMSTKGQGTRAAKDLIDALAETDEPIRVFALHDADAAGTLIYQALQEATIARQRRKLEIVNLGLEPWQARELGLPAEPVNKKTEAHRPVAEYVKQRDDGEDWGEWLQHWRYELDSIPPDDFIPWLDRKMAEHDATKAVPDPETLAEKVETRARERLRSTARAEIERLFDLDGLLERFMDSEAAQTVVETVADDVTPDAVAKAFEDDREQWWRNVMHERTEAVVEAAASEITEAIEALLGEREEE